MPSSLFVSDLHLTEARPEANEKFFSFIEETASRATSLYILGDLFEYWIGDDDLDEPFHAVIAGFLRRLSDSGIALGVMQGNRDFLMGERFCSATGARLLPDPTVIELGAARTLLTHGDTLCTDDHDYQAWRNRRIAQHQRILSGKFFRARNLVLARRDNGRRRHHKRVYIGKTQIHRAKEIGAPVDHLDEVCRADPGGNDNGGSRPSASRRANDQKGDGIVFHK